MADLLKDKFNENFVNELSLRIKKNYQKFDETSFKNEVFDKNWVDLNLKERSKHISLMMAKYLPRDYKKAIKILLKTSKGMTGLTCIIFPDFVELFGLDDWDISIDALEKFTSCCTSEFAIRFFILEDWDRLRPKILEWTKSKDEHIRRLASEGCRPILPWAIDIPLFRKNPESIIEILDNLKNDPSEYVRKSVANNLNSISKDNPETAIKLAKLWYGQDKDLNKIVKHGCRTLFKNGDVNVLELFGYNKPNHIEINKFKIDKKVKIGDKFNFSFNIKSNNKHLGKLRIEYIMSFVRKNDRYIEKVFKISEADYKEPSREIKRYYDFKKITTRNYYKGLHSITLVINGERLIKKDFTLT